jgi:hypothetical protein
VNTKASAMFGSEGKFVSQKKESQRDIPKNMWAIPFLSHAYDVKRSNFQNEPRDDKLGINMLTGWGIAKASAVQQGRLRYYK